MKLTVLKQKTERDPANAESRSSSYTKYLNYYMIGGRKFS